MTDRKTAVGLAAMCLGLVAALVAAATLYRTGGETTVGANVLVNPPGVISVNNSPTVATDPDDRRRAVVAHRIDRPGFSALLEWSADGGATWQPTSLPLPAGTEPCAASPEQKPCPFAADVAFGPDGTLYVVYLSLQGRGNTPAALWLARSTDGGRTLEQPVRVAGELSFQPRVVVDDAGSVHLVWLDAEAVGLNQLVGPARVVTARSGDGGRTFSTPVAVSDASRERVGAASPVIDSGGDVVVLYQDFKNDRRNFGGLQGPVAEDPYALVVTRSTDGGRTFGQGVEIESNFVPARRFLVFLPEYPSLAAGPDGSLSVAWADGRNGNEDVFLRRSEDGGGTWSDATRVNDNAMADGTSQYLPRVAVAPDGRVDVLFYDRRGDPADVQTEVYLASSEDGRDTFTNVRVSSQPFSSAVGPTFGPEYGTDFGTRLGLVSTEREALASWTDTRLGDVNTGRQDVFAATVTLGSGGPLSRTAPVLILLSGLVAVVAVLTLIRKQARPRTQPTGAEA